MPPAPAGQPSDALVLQIIKCLKLQMPDGTTLDGVDPAKALQAFAKVEAGKPKPVAVRHRTAAQALVQKEGKMRQLSREYVEAKDKLERLEKELGAAIQEADEAAATVQSLAEELRDGAREEPEAEEEDHLVLDQAIPAHKELFEAKDALMQDKKALQKLRLDHEKAVLDMQRKLDGAKVAVRAKHEAVKTAASSQASSAAGPLPGQPSPVGRQPRRCIWEGQCSFPRLTVSLAGVSGKVWAASPG